MRKNHVVPEAYATLTREGSPEKVSMSQKLIDRPSPGSESRNAAGDQQF
jgi:hypothetical protein